MVGRAKTAAAALIYVGVVAAQVSNLWLDVPFVKQSPEGCGAASIAMVMQYWAKQANADAGQTSDPNYIFEKLHSSAARGIYAKQMERYLAEHGFRTFAFRGTWSDLKDHLNKGRPLIVALKPSAGSAALHYVVVAGLDDNQGLILFNDPAGRKLTKLDRKSFEKEWKATNQWTLLVVPESSAH